MIRYLLLTFFVIMSFLLYAQQPPAATFGGFHSVEMNTTDEISDQQREAMNQQVRENLRILARKGITAENQLQRTMATKYGFPLRKADGFTDRGFYGISNFVDVQPGVGIKDFNCGTRTYNGHMGTDFFTAPFWWKKMEENSVEIVAAADGIIVARESNIDDKSCQNCPTGSPQGCFAWNAVYLQHADGTLTMYGHMKKNSLTPKQVGESVVKGEFLGIVGSSGNSSGPHLHFEVWKDTTFTEYYDPWEGSCNPDGNASMWEDQLPYYNPKILKVMTGTNVPEVKQCYGSGIEKTYEATVFSLGEETVYITAFVTDHRYNNPPFNLALVRPDGTLRYNWTLAGFRDYPVYSWAYFYYTFPPSDFDMAGQWKFTLNYGTETEEIEFNVLSPAPLDLVSFNAQKSARDVLLQWQTENEQNTERFEIERSHDGNSFSRIGSLPSKGNGNTGRNHYSFADSKPSPQHSFYRLKMTDLDGKYKYSEIVKVAIGEVKVARIFPNPAKSFVDLIDVTRYNKAIVSDMNGRIVLSSAIAGNEQRLDISKLNAGLYVIHLTGDGSDVKLKLVKQ